MADEHVVFRSCSWDGPDPQSGDHLVDNGRVFRVVAVAAGPGCGHWRLTCAPAGRVIVWDAVDARQGT